MAKYSNTIEYALRTTLDDTGIAKLQTEIREVSAEIKNLNALNLIDPAKAQKAVTELKTIENAFTKAFNPKLNMLDMKKLGAELTAQKVSIQSMSNAFAQAGAKGTIAFNNTIAQLGKIDLGLKSITSTTDKVFNTIGNTVRWGIVASGFQSVLNAMHDAADYVKDLDRSLTDIMMVTDYSRQQMQDYAKSANEAAQALGSTTVAMTDATLVFAQQGFDLDMSSQMAELSTKLANASQQETAATSDQITAMMNAYKIEGKVQEIGDALDSWAEVANVSAADVQELAVGFQKAGATAATVGVTMDQLNAQIATIESVTREAPENIGNGLKTLYARFADISLGETLEDGVDLGQVTSLLEKVGVTVLNSEGKMRDVGVIMEDLMDVWQTLDTTTKNAVATSLAGKYQLSRFEALMNRSDLYDQYKESSENAEGTLDVMNDKYVNSLQGKMNQLQTSFEGVISNVVNTDSFYEILDALTEVVNLFDNLIESIGGAGQALTALGAIATKTFSANITSGIGNMISNLQTKRMQESNKDYNQVMLRELGASDAVLANEEASRPLLNFAQKTAELDQYLTQDQIDQRNEAMEKLKNSTNEVVKAEDDLKLQVEATNAAYRIQGLINEDDEDVITQREDGSYDFSGIERVRSKNMAEGFQSEIDVNWLNRTDEKGLENYSSQVRVLGELLGETAQEFRNSKDDTDKYDKALKNSSTIIDEFIDTQGKILGSSKQAEKAFSKLVKVNNELKEIQADPNAEPEVIERYIEACQQAVKETGEFIEQAKKGNVITSMDEGTEKSNNVEGKKTQRDANQGLADALDKGGEVQKLSGQLLNASAAVGQLAFAWQSFQSLGSIWTNDDLSQSEKMTQTLLNLVTTVPMAASGFIDLGKNIKGVTQSLSSMNIVTTLTNTLEEISSANSKKIADRKQKENAALIQNTGAKSGNAVATTGMAAAEGAATGATKLFSAAFKALTSTMMANPIFAVAAVAVGALTAALGVAAAAIGSAEEAEKQHAEAVQAEVDAAKELNAQIENSNFKELNKTYEETGEVTDQLRDSTIQVAEALGIQNAALIESQAGYDALHNLVTRALEDNNDLEESLIKQQSLQAAQNGKSNAFDDNTLGDMLQEQFTLNAYDGGRRNQMIEYLGYDPKKARTEEELQESIFRIAQARKDIVDDIAKTEEELAAAEEEKEKARAAGDQAALVAAIQRTDELKTQRDTQLGIQSELENLWTNEDINVAGQYDTAEQLAKIAANKEDVLGSLDETANAVDILNKLLESDDKNIQGLFGNAETYAEQLQVALQLVDDDAQKLALTLESLKISSEEGFVEKYKELFAEGQDVSLFTNENTLDAANMREYSGQEAEAVYARWMELLENSGLTQEEQLEFMANIDWNQSWPEIAAQFEALSEQNPMRAVIDGDVVVATDRFTETEEEIDALIKSSSMGAEGFQRFSTAITDKLPEYQEAQEELRNIQNAIADGSMTAEEGSKKIEELNTSISQMEEVGTSLAARNVRLNQGVSDLVDNWEELGDVLTNEANKGTADYYTALGKLDTIMSDILDIDVGVLSEGFYQNADAIQAMTDAANGNAEAIDTLRELATEDIIAHIGIDTTALEDGQTADAIRESLMDKLDGFQQVIDDHPGLQITPEMDTSGFLDQINQLLATCAITSEQATQILSAFGMEGVVDTVEGDGYVQETTYTMQAHGTTPVYTTISGPIEGKTPSLPGVAGLPLYGGGSSSATYVTQVPNFSIVPETKDSKTKIQVPTITGATYSGKGVTSVGAKSLQGTKKKSSSSGGSKSGGSSSKPSTKKYKNETPDRYQKVNSKISSVSKEYDKIAANQDRIVGKDYSANLEKQIDLLEDQVELHKEKLAIQEQEADELQASLSGTYGIKFESDGSIANYDKVFAAEQKRYNKMVEKYNNSTEEEKEKADKDDGIHKGWMAAAEERWNVFLEQHKRYNELWSNDIPEEEKILQDLEDQIEDIRINAIKAANEVINKIKKLNERMVDFNRALKNIKSLRNDNPLDDMADGAERIGYYLSDSTASADKLYNSLIRNARAAGDITTANFYEQAKQGAADRGWNNTNQFGNGYLGASLDQGLLINEQIDQWLATGTSDIFGEDSAAMFEVAEDVLQRMQDTVIDLAQEMIEFKESILRYMDNMAEAIAEHNQKYQDIIDDLQYYSDMSSLIHGDENWEEQNAYLQQQITTRNELIDIQRKELQSWYTIMNETEDKTSDVYKNAAEKAAELEKEVKENTKENVQAINTVLQNGVKAITRSWANGLMNMKNAAGGTLGDFTSGQLGKALDNALRDKEGNVLLKDLDWMATEWDLINRKADYYLDDVNAAYNIQKLQNKYLDLLDDASESSLGIQNKITDQMREQLGYLRNKKNLSEYDVAYAEAQLEILQKTIALEDARANKKQMRLRRDSQGNYRYQYIANEEDTRDAENDLLDAQNNAYNLSKDQIKQTQTDALSAVQSAISTVENIMSNASLTIEDRNAQIKKVFDSLEEYVGDVAEQLGVSEQNIIQDFVGMCELLTEENDNKLEDIYQGILNGQYEMFDQIDTRWSTSIADWLYNTEQFEAACDKAYEEIIAAGENWTNSISEQQDLVQEDWNDTTGNIKECDQALKDLLGTNQQFIDQINQSAGTVNEYNEQLLDYQKRIEDLTYAQGQYQQTIQALNEKIASLEAEKAASTTATATTAQNKEKKTSDNNKSKSKSSTGNKSSGKYAGTSYDEATLIEGIAGNIWTYGSWKSGDDRLGKIKKKFGNKGSEVYSKVQAKFNAKNAYGYDYDPPHWAKEGYGYYEKFAYSSFDTGGYTGKWGNTDGRLAVLHQKELVLNAEDTENILKVVDMVRTITQAMQGGVSGIASSLFSKMPTMDTQKIEQEVHIDAEFPNVQDSHEIEEALLDLINQVPQYAMKTR